MARLTIAQITTAVRKALGTDDIELVRDARAGYFYFTGVASEWAQSGVYVYRVSDLTLEQWVAEAKGMANARNLTVS